MAKESVKEFALRIEEEWANRYETSNLKRGTKTYQLAHNSFFLGAMLGADINVPYWSICISCGRDVLDLKDKNQENDNRN